MSCRGHTGLWLGLAIGVQITSGLWAAEVTDQAMRSPMPQVQSPVDYFRKLLAMNPDERRHSLTNRPVESQKRILAKVHEYEALKPEECQLRLQATELHFYLVQLLGTPATNRPAQLKFIPEETRKLVQARLEQLDSLPEGLKQRLLENEAMIHYFIERVVHLPPQPGQPAEAMPPGDREKLEQSLRRWQSLTPEERASILKDFKKLFDLTPEEKTNVLARLSEPERLQIEKTLQNFGNLTPMQRAQCMRSFEKFAGLSPDERRQFLVDASRWEVIPPTERQTWRDLVEHLRRLPLPPGLGAPPIPRPPPMLRPANTPQVTNAN